MLNTLAKKKEVVATLAQTFKDSKSIVFFNFHKLKMADTMAMRRKLRAEKVGTTVAKKTLMKRALAEVGFEGTMPELEGEIGLAFAPDLTAPARELYEFQKKYKESLSIVGGVFDGKFLSKEEMLVIANIPSQKTLYAQFVNVINSPIQGLVVALNQIASKKTA